MKHFIQLTGYYPYRHVVLVAPDAIVGITQNCVSEKSKGSTVYIGGTSINVLEEPMDVIELLNVSIKQSNQT